MTGVLPGRAGEKISTVELLPESPMPLDIPASCGMRHAGRDVSPGRAPRPDTLLSSVPGRPLTTIMSDDGRWSSSAGTRSVTGTTTVTSAANESQATMSYSQAGSRAGSRVGSESVGSSPPQQWTPLAEVTEIE